MEMVLKGREAICEAVNESPKDFLRLVRDEGLPAWRRNEGDAWRALPEELAEWMRSQSAKYREGGE